MGPIRAALIASIRQWAAGPAELMFVTVINGYSIALFREDLPDTDEALSQLLDERLAQRPCKSVLL